MATMTPKKKHKHSARRLTDTSIETALIAARGNVSYAASSLGVSRNAIYAHIQKNPQLAQVLTDAREAIVDAAENALMAAVVAKQGWAVCFTLKTIGRDRGYVERVEQQHSGQVAIMSINYADLTDEQLQRIANGEHPATVIASTSGR
jgi:hypothetical protein